MIYQTLDGFAENKLAMDYIQNVHSQLLPAHFRDESSWLKQLNNKSTTHNILIEVLREQNFEFNMGSATSENIDKLSHAQAHTVVTGQQAGLFTGPLYTIYKALTAIKLSNQLKGKYGVEFVPVFWIESNDHDFNEVNHINVLDSGDALVKIEYIPSNYRYGSPIKDVKIDESIRDIIKKLEEFSPETEFKCDVFDILRDSYLSGLSFNQAFGRMMMSLFKDFGLILLDPSDHRLKELMIPLMHREIESELETTNIVNLSGRKLRSIGYQPQIERSEYSTNLFLEEDGIRYKLMFINGRFLVNGQGRSLSSSEVIDMLYTQPWKFSPNVCLRPVIQDYILRTVAYVAGPAEISYFAQLKELYEYMDVEMPIIYPRASFIIVEPKVQHAMQVNGLNISELSEDYEKLFAKLSRRKISNHIEESIESIKSKIAGMFKELSADLKKVDPNMVNIVESTAIKIYHQIDQLKEKTYQMQRNRDEITKRQVKRACMNIYPLGKHQERVFNIVQYLVLHGMNFLNELYESLECYV